MLDEEFLNSMISREENMSEKEIDLTRVLFNSFNDYGEDVLDSWKTCKFFTQLLTKIQKMEDRIVDLELIANRFSNDIQQLNDQINEKEVYMEDW